jgi:tRNA U38,U39,U40 pseudouridine synthase TruA
MSKSELKKLLEARDRTLGPTTASARGLFLVKVFYNDEEWRNFEVDNVPFFI